MNKAVVISMETLDYEDYKRRASMERKKVYLPGLDFLFGMLYIASVGFLVRNREGKFRRPKCYWLYSVFSIVHTVLAFYGMYHFAIITSQLQEFNQVTSSDRHTTDSVALRLIFACILTQFANAVLSKIVTCITNETRRRYYTEMERAYVDICGDNPRAKRLIWTHMTIAMLLHCAVFAVSLSFTTMQEFRSLYGPYTSWFPIASEIMFAFMLYSAFSMSTVANATSLVLVQSACTLTEINRSLNSKLRVVTSAPHTRWWLTKDADLLLERYRRLFKLYGDFKQLLSFRVFSQFSVTTLNLVITAYIHYMDEGNISQTKIHTISANVLFFALLFWSAYEIHRMKTKAEVPVQLLSSSKFLPSDAQRTDELRMFIIMWQSQDVRISASGFFTVDLSLIVSIISTVVTYTVILVQVKSYRPCFADYFCKGNSTRTC